MNERTEILVRGGLSLLAIAIVWWRARHPGRLPQTRAGQPLALLAAVAVAAYFNFGWFHGWSFAHHWETFHYFLGSKYFPELGYDGLYAASIEAQMGVAPGQAPQPHVRDLRTNEVVPTSATIEHRQEVRRRFTPERWQLFVADNSYFVTSLQPQWLTQIRCDHGYNPSPTWTFVARLFSRWLPASRPSLTWLGIIDPVLLGIAFVVLFRTYGSRVGAVALVIAGLGYAWRFYWVGGAFLRQDWLVAVILAVCAVKRRRFALAGAGLGYATLVRVFPVVFLFGLGVQALRDIVRREDWRWSARVAGGFALTVALGLAGGCLVGRGVEAWPGFAANLAKHQRSWLTNNVGLPNVLLYDRETVERRLVDWSLREPWAVWQVKMDQLSSSRRPLVLAAGALLLFLAACAAWRVSNDEAVALGVVAAFSLLLLTCYYWSMLLLIAVRRRWGLVVGVLALNVCLCGLHFMTQSFELIYGVMSWGLLAVSLAWVGPHGFALLRARGADARFQREARK